MIKEIYQIMFVKYFGTFQDVKLPRIKGHATPKIISWNLCLKKKFKSLIENDLWIKKKPFMLKESMNSLAIHPLFFKSKNVQLRFKNVSNILWCQLLMYDQ